MLRKREGKEEGKMCKSVAAIMLYYLVDCVPLQIEINIRKKVREEGNTQTIMPAFIISTYQPSIFF